MSRLEPIAENKPSTDTSSSSRRSALIEQLQQQLDKANRDLVQKNIQLEHQLEIAAQVHESMLPKPVTHPKIDVDIRYLPIEAVGGDYCQVRIPQPDTCYITMCDVTGHGIGAALMATRVSSEVRHFILDMLEPKQIVSELNSFIMNDFADTGLFLTFFAVRIDLKNRTLTYSGSGNPPALLLRANGEQPVIL
ncbi:MAG: serine/threonine-protein phosphatase, partial [Planctomycetes bacterium]|nr:serine/threonine-protein phosphatase [Planctomycetota bacterium]